MSSINNPGQAMAMVFRSPSQVFLHLKTQDYWSWWPFIIVLLASSGVSFAYYQLVDWPWYLTTYITDHMVGMSNSKKSTALEFITRDNIQISTVFVTAFSLLLINSCYAFYLSKLTQLDDDNVQTFGDWFGLCWWTQLPVVITATLGILWMLIAGPQLDPTKAMAPLSLAALLDISIQSQWYNLCSSLSLVTLWTISLQILVVTAWTNLSRPMASAIVIAPYLLIFGIWALLV